MFQVRIDRADDGKSLLVCLTDPSCFVLREQGAAALKAQLGETKPFVQALFERERDLETLDTPERRAGLNAAARPARCNSQTVPSCALSPLAP